MSGKKILWLSHFVPYPPKGGCFQRSYNLIKEISSKNDLYLIALKHKDSTHPDFDISIAKSELGKLCREVIIIDISSSTSGTALYATAIKSLFTTTPMSVNMFKSQEMHEAIRRIKQKVNFQVVHFDTISMAEYIGDFSNVPMVMNHHGVESFMIKRRVENEPNFLNKMYLMIEGLKLERYEKKYCPRFDMNLAVSVLDKDLMGSITGIDNIEVIENGVDIKYFSPPENLTNNKNIIFAGRLDQYSNRESILYFCAKVWPIIKKQNPDIRFVIIGNNPPAKLAEIANKDKNIDLLGYVDDVRPHFATAMISVCPIKDGGGTRIKILDALAMGMPIVSTSIGCEGIDVTPGIDVFIADTPQEFADKVNSILTDICKRQSLSKNARKTAEDKYSWKVISEKLDHVYSRFL
jgi:glycosyltransferase involved in cell wall biosynthesis